MSLGLLRQLRKEYNPLLSTPQEDICHFPFLQPRLPLVSLLLVVEQSSRRPAFPRNKLMATPRDLDVHTHTRQSDCSFYATLFILYS